MQRQESAPAHSLATVGRGDAIFRTDRPQAGDCLQTGIRPFCSACGRRPAVTIPGGRCVVCRQPGDGVWRFEVPRGASAGEKFAHVLGRRRRSPSPAARDDESELSSCDGSPPRRRPTSETVSRPTPRRAAISARHAAVDAFRPPPAPRPSPKTTASRPAPICSAEGCTLNAVAPHPVHGYRTYCYCDAHAPPNSATRRPACSHCSSHAQFGAPDGRGRVKRCSDHRLPDDVHMGPGVRRCIAPGCSNAATYRLKIIFFCARHADALEDEDSSSDAISDASPDATRAPSPPAGHSEDAGGSSS